MGKGRGSGILYICCITLLLSSSVSAQTKVIDGTFDLRGKGVPNDQILSLAGHWEFYWEKHYSPDDFERGFVPYPDLFGKVPAYWTNYSDVLPEITGSGFATYRLMILLPENYRKELIFRIPVFDSSCRVYFNGKAILTSGIPGEKESETSPGYKPFSYSLIPASDTIEIIINVSNYHHRRGGFWLPIKFGTREIVTLKTSRENFFNSSTAGMLISFVGFFFLFFIMFKHDRSMLYFSITTLGVLIRSVSTGMFSIQSFFDISWTWLIRLEYIGSYIAFIFALLYFNSLYPNRIARFLNPVLIVLFSLCIMTVMVTPVTVFSHTMLVFMPLIPVLLLYYMVYSFISLIRKPGYEVFIATGFFALIIGAVNDIALANSVILLADSYILAHTVVFFILMQVIILQYRWVHSYNEERRLLNEIEFVNKNLENMVIERTTELTNQKVELEIQKCETGKKNRELEKTISIKNRIFSIIAHDLKSPVLNISLMIDHLMKNNDRQSFNRLMESLAQQAGFATNLIDNLLLWIDGQQNRIRYEVGKHNITDIILSNFNLLRESANRKEIQMTYSHKGDPHALCDKGLLNIVIRNLLSNAVKFTQYKGNISVSVEESALKDGTVKISISDNGIGIPPDKLLQIINHEIIDSSAGTDNEKGTGLGLQLCFDLIRINKGILTIESVEGVGSCFTIKIPSPSGKDTAN
ncbi:MAG TPA: sensor histidine kinase [Bacteroidales bacterium]|nr:sensor histidine kinase [Bacteroidales bacterium]